MVFSIYDGATKFVGYYTLVNKSVNIPTENISKTTQKRVGKFAQFDKSGKFLQIPMPLIAQLNSNRQTNLTKPLFIGFVGCFCFKVILFF